MDWLKNRQALSLILKKYGWALLVLAVGIVLMAMPTDRAPERQISAAPEPAGEEELSSQLEKLLGRLSGAGKVSVLLTRASGAVTHYQTDQSRNSAEGSEDLRQTTVIVSDSSRSQTGLVRRVDPPIYQGAVILCQGADSPQIRLAVVEAVSKATGLTSDKIAVLKMK